MTPDISQSADHGLAARRPPKRYAALTLPMLVELDQQRFVTYHEPRLWGAYYQDFLGEQQRLVAGELDGRVLPPGGERRANRLVVIAGAVGGIGAAVLLVVFFVAHLAGAI